MNAMFFSVILLCLTLMLSACDKQKGINTLQFFPEYQMNKLQCFSPFTLAGKTWQYSQLQFFVSDVAVKNNQGKWQVWPLKNNDNQSDNVALLGDYCQSSKNKQSNWQLVFENPIKPSNLSEIRFTLGVPFLVNHQNPLLQSSPLNVPNMFWVWQTGHKFFRLDMEEVNEFEQKDNWQFHLGSTGCKAPSPLRPPNKPCINGNQVTVTLDVNEHLSEIELSLTGLFTNIVITKGNSCQSETDNQSCHQLFNNIGLNEQQQSIFQTISSVLSEGK